MMKARCKRNYYLKSKLHFKKDEYYEVTSMSVSKVYVVVTDHEDIHHHFREFELEYSDTRAFTDYFYSIEEIRDEKIDTLLD